MKKSRIASPFPTQNRPCVICRSSIVVDPAYGLMACAEDRHATRHSPYTHRMPAPEPIQPLSDAEVSKVARLARLTIPENRIHPLRDQLAAVLTYGDRLRASGSQVC